MNITIVLVTQLIKEQFPQWEHLGVEPVENSGHDNRCFHLGNDMLIRLPSGEAYASQIAKEQKWLPYLQKHLPYPITSPIAIGQPTKEYPYPWSINQWIDGQTLLECPSVEKVTFAKDLAHALALLQRVPCENGPQAGEHNFYRGGSLAVYHQQTIDALAQLTNRVPTDILLSIWQECKAIPYDGEARWVHGDIAPGNILLKDAQFYGLIDFGILGVGDPACDYAMAWTFFDVESRRVFLKGLSEDMIHRARGWALWKALITYDDEHDLVKESARNTIKEIIQER